MAEYPLKSIVVCFQLSRIFSYFTIFTNIIKSKFVLHCVKKVNFYLIRTTKGQRSHYVLIDSHHQLICSASTIFGTLALNGLSDTHVCLQYSTDFLKTSGFLTYFTEYRKRPVSYNGLKICLTNTSAEC